MWWHESTRGSSRWRWAHAWSGYPCGKVRRLRIRLARRGRAALLHGNRGRAPSNKLDAATQARVLTLRQTKYAGFNDTHFAEKLATETPPVHGSSALAALYARIPVGHVEAGLRACRRDSPFPEELNRQITTVLADWHYVPTDWARDTLLRAGVASETITVTGNPVTDALHWITGRVDDAADVVPSLYPSSRMILVTAA